MGKEVLQGINFSLAENVLELGRREKNAIKRILNDIFESQETGKEQNRIRLVITSENPFKLVEFGNVISEIGINMNIDSAASKGYRKDNSTVIIFQPKLNEDSDFVKEITKSRDSLNHFIKKNIDF